MAEPLLWLDALPEIEGRRSECDRAVSGLQLSLVRLTAALATPNSTEIVAAHGGAVTAWSTLLNAADRFAAFGQSIGKNYPEQTKYLVGGTILELVDNLLSTAAALRPHSGNGPDPLALAAEQPLAMQFAKELIGAHFPEEVPRFRRKFESLGLPTSGLPDEAARPVHTTAKTIRILHISDLHRTPDEKVTNDEVREDLLQGIADIDPTPFDLIVVSGDLTQSAEPDQYKECEALLSALVKRFLGGNKGRCIVVPGNHDVHWPTSIRGTFTMTKANPNAGGEEPPGGIEFGSVVATPLKGSLLKVRKNFRDSYRRFFGRPYPPNVKDGCLYLEPPGLGLGIVAIDTNVGMHHLNDMPRVDRDSLVNCLSRLPKTGERSFVLAVGHHGPVRRLRQSDAIDTWVLDRLLHAGVVLYLHGHVHEPQLYFHSEDGVTGLFSIGVGSLVAGRKERPESTPRYYHVIEVPPVGRRGRVYVRQKARRDAAWKADRTHGPPADPVDFLEFG